MSRKITKRDFVHIRPTEEQKELARVMSENVPKNIRNSIKKGEGRHHGSMGELLGAGLIGATISNTKDYDLIMPNGITIDVKTGICNSVPQLNYAVNVAAFNINQMCDYYLFFRIKEDFSDAWMLGALSKKEYFRIAVKRDFKQRDPNDTHGVGFDFKATCYNLLISSLKPITYKQLKSEQNAQA